jgi:hypothetical protein
MNSPAAGTPASRTDEPLREPDYETDHNVYILGAGFSRPAGLPLMMDFLAAMRSAHRRLSGDPSRKAECDAIAEVLRFRLRAAAASHRIPLDVENIETLFSLASVHSPSPLEEALPLAIAATLDAAPRGGLERVNIGPHSGERAEVPLPRSWQGQEGRAVTPNAPLYEFYAAILSGAFRTNRPRSTFVSFNYDTILEDALQAIEIPTDFGFGSDSVQWASQRCPGNAPGGVAVLKLHGSVSWGRGLGLKPTIYPDYKTLRLANDRPAIVPPTWKKVFGSALGSVWERAIREISIATRLVFIGFSFPSTDLHVRYLLGAAFMDNISLQEVLVIDPACGTPAFGERLRSLFRPELSVTLVSATAEQVLGRQDGRARIGRLPPPGYVYPFKKDGAFTQVPLWPR